MSDLQCACRLLVAGTTAAETDALCERMSGERLAAIYAAAEGSVAQTLSRRTGAPVLPLTLPVDLHSLRKNCPEALAQLREIADQHRGETVLVLPPEDVDPSVVTVLVDSDGIVIGEE